MAKAARRGSGFSLPPFSVLYAIGVIVFIAVQLFQWPVISFDTDLWYHLNGGRAILTNHQIPQSSFFSFIEPARSWVNYYWLFQVAVYSLYAHAGFIGLIILRGLICCATMSLVLATVFYRRASRVSWPWLAFIALGCCFIILPRHLNVRPHLFSYFFIAASIALLEHRPRWCLWALPLIGVFWANLHGVTFPIMLLIIAAYGLEYGWLNRRAPQRFKALAGLMLMAMTIVLTPHGLALLRVPFISTQGASEYIAELQPFVLSDLLSAEVLWLTPSIQTIFNIYLFAATVTVAVVLWQRQVPVYRLLLIAGGYLLLFKGKRFGVEFALLALPLLRAYTPVPEGGISVRIPRPARLALLFIAFLLPLQVAVFFFGEKPAFPVSYRGLPKGVAGFLKSIAVGGKVLNHPNQGGYYQWMLWPSYQIFMDMEIPFLFKDADMRLVSDVYTKEQTLSRMLAKYRPGFIAVPIQTKSFPDLIKHHPEYVPIFFDESEVLYTDRSQYPGLAQRYELHSLKPFAYFEKTAKEVVKQTADREAFMNEIARLLASYPDSGVLNQLAALLYKDESAYDRMLPFAHTLIARSPDSPVGYQLEGDAFKGLHAYSQAIEIYRTAIRMYQPNQRSGTYRDIGMCYFELGEYQKAYHELHRTVSQYDEPSDEDLYYLAASAIRVNRRQEAEDIANYLATYRAKPNDRTWVDRIGREFTLSGR